MSGPRVRRRSATTLLLALAVLLGACGRGVTTSDDDADAGSSGLDGSWELVAGRDAEGALPLGDGVEVTLVVKGSEASGTSACNLYGATLTVEGELVSIGQVAGTEMACDPAVMELERRYLAALTTTERAERSGDTLVLSGPGVELALGLEAPVADRDLVGTSWILESLVAEESVSSALPGGEVVFRGDATFDGATGCGPLVGGYELHGQDVTVTDLSAYRPRTGGCRRDAEVQHEHTVAVFSDGFAVQIDGDTLTLTSQQGLGLVLRAE